MPPQHGLPTVISHGMMVFMALVHIAMSGLKLVTGTSAGKCKAVLRSTWNIQSLADCSDSAY